MRQRATGRWPGIAARGALVFLAAAAIFSMSCRREDAITAGREKLRIEVAVDKLRPRPGETVSVSAVVKTAGSLDDVNLAARRSKGTSSRCRMSSSSAISSEVPADDTWPARRMSAIKS